MGGTRFMVQWEEHPSHLATRLGHLLEHQTLVDVTLMCNTHTLRVHRAVLAACSPYFETILQRQLGMHPLIVLKDMQFSVLKSLIEFMYCGETSVTEDNLGPLLQAAKFFQVKGLSAMTKEALGLGPTTGSKGDAARKAFVGRSKRVPIQQNFVTKSLPSCSTNTSQLTVDSKHIIQQPGTKSLVVQQPDNQQQTDTAQLLLSLSSSEYTKQSFQTVSKTVKFQNSPVTSAAKNESLKPRTKTETLEQVTTVAPVNSSRGITPVSLQTSDHSSLKDNSIGQVQTAFLTEPMLSRKRGRPVKRQMNIAFQEKVLTDADMALHKEAEASRKALEVLRQEMAVEPLDKTQVAVVQQPDPLRKITPHSGTLTMKLQNTANSVTAVPRVSSRIQTTSIKKPVSHTTYITKTIQNVVPSVNAPRKTLIPDEKSADSVKRIIQTQEQKPHQIVETNTVPSQVVTTNAVSSTPVQVSNECSGANSNVIYQVGNTVVTNPEMFQIVDNNSANDKAENIVYQVTDGATAPTTDAHNTSSNIIYQMPDTGNNSSVVGQYMDVLKEAGIPTDVPILLDSGDGSYVTVNEEMLMNIVNGGVFQCQVAEGNLVAGERLEFIVQEVEGGVQPAADQVQETALPSVADSTETNTVVEATQEIGGTSQSVSRDMPTIEMDQPENSVIETDPSDSNAEPVNTLSEETKADITTPVGNQEIFEERYSSTSVPESSGATFAENSVDSQQLDTQNETSKTQTFTFDSEITSLKQKRESQACEDTVAKVEKDSDKTNDIIYEVNEVPVETHAESLRNQKFAIGKQQEHSSANNASLFKDANMAAQNISENHCIVLKNDSQHLEEHSIVFTSDEASGLPSLEDCNGSREMSEIDSFNESETKLREEERNEDIIAEHSNSNSSEHTLSAVEDDKLSDTEISADLVTHDSYSVSQSEGTLISADGSFPIHAGRTPQKCRDFSGSINHFALDNSNCTGTTDVQMGEGSQHNSLENNGVSVEQALETMMDDGDVKKTDCSDDDAVPVLAEANDTVVNSTHVKNETADNEELQEMLSREEVEEVEVQNCELDSGIVTGSFTLVVDRGKHKMEQDNSVETNLSNTISEITDDAPNSPADEIDIVEHIKAETLEVVEDSEHYFIDDESIVLQDTNTSNIESDRDVEGNDCTDETAIIVHNVGDQEVVPEGEIHKICVSGIGDLPQNYVLITDGKTQGQITSPNKDIPLAVGLLPLKTALQKFQSMPDHQPRKTRSSSTGKEGSVDAPAGQVKRKASTESGPDKRLRVDESSADESFDEVASPDTAEVQDNPDGWSSVDLNEDEHREGVHAMVEIVTETTEV